MIILTARALKNQAQVEMVKSMTFLGYQMMKHVRRSASIKVSWDHTKSIHGKLRLRTAKN